MGTSGGDSCCDSSNSQTDVYMGYDIDTLEVVNLVEHIEQGFYGFDEDWRVVSNYTLDAIIKNKKGTNRHKKGRL